jgi:alpha-L-rhamnosidase
MGLTQDTAEAHFPGEWIGAALAAEEPANRPPAYLMKTFVVEAALHSASLEMTAFGIFDPYINGERVSENYFNPGWTDYNKRVYSRSFDIAERLQPGEGKSNAHDRAICHGIPQTIWRYVWPEN